jgi:thioredoxin-dependent peroxiredoxin
MYNARSMLKEGDSAPTFTLTADNGASISLSDFRGRPLVVYFYPKDNTPGCTREAQAFSEASARFEELGASVVGISRDTQKSHASFRDKYTLQVPLLSDPDRVAHDAFGAFGLKTMYGKKITGTIRSTFVIDAEGKVAKVFPSVRVDGHVDAVLAAVAAIGKEPPKSAPKKKK